jgi:DNA-nicking Smr family endonuclease|eukprot:COSAG01_NODE_2334_length_7882_cov_105.499807_3_plen_64_part_00
MMTVDFPEILKKIVDTREKQAEARAAVEEAQTKLGAMIREAVKMGIDNYKVTTKGGKTTIVIG